jgi:hypothetical protein
VSGALSFVEKWSARAASSRRPTLSQKRIDDHSRPVMRRHSLTVLCTLCASVRAHSAIYESPVSVEDEDDVFAMGERGELSDATVQTLLELMEDGVDLNTAGRDELYELPGLTYSDVDAIIAFRTAHGGIDDPSQLVAAGALTAEQLLEIAPFVLSTEPGGGSVPLSGHYRAMGLYTLTDTQAPPAFLQAQLRGPVGMSGGIGITTTRNRVGSPAYDPDRDTLTVDPNVYTVNVPKFFLQWRSAHTKILFGTFRIGFGERLTLDDTTRYTPHGIYSDDIFFPPGALTGSCHLSTGELPSVPCDTGDKSHYQTSDFRWRDPFRGVAASIENLPLGSGWSASLYGFGSYQTRSIYQYQIYDRRFCDDPRSTSAECSAPDVFLRAGDGSGLEPKLAYATLPAVLDEIAAAGHAELGNSMFTIGVTGYGAIPKWHVPELALDFQEWAKYPFGGPFGAVGINGRATLDDWNLFLELARSFDMEPGGGGGFGAVARAVYGVKRRELELVARYYDIRFVNPYARPVSSPDEIDGSRARDEAGFRVKYTDRSLGAFTLRSFIDFWVLPYDAKTLDAVITGNNDGYKAGTANLWGHIRGDYTGWRLLEPSLWFDYRNKNLASSGYGACYSSSDSRYVPGGVLCSGELYRIAARLDFRPLGNKLELLLTYMHDLVSDLKYTDRLDQDMRVTLEVRSEPTQWLLVRARARYLHADIFTNNRLEESLWSFLALTYTGFRALHVTVRYDNYLWLDQRTSTLNRVPNPENRLRLELAGRF